MLAPIWQRAAHRGVPIFLVTALLLGQSPMALAESPAQRQELVAALRQLRAAEGQPPPGMQRPDGRVGQVTGEFGRDAGIGIGDATPGHALDQVDDRAG